MVCAISVILVVDVFLPPSRRRATFYLTMLALLGTALCSLYYGAGERTTLLYDSFVADPAGNALKLFAYAIVALVFLYSRDYLEREGLYKGEYFILGLFALLGIMVMISANSLLILYLGLELLSLALYALVAFDRESSIAAESAMKYFVLGAIASGTLLYGISVLYGITGTVDIGELGAYFSAGEGPQVAALLGLAFVIVGVAFKFGAVPFHMWLPDVYQGARTPVTLFISTAPKLASFALAPGASWWKASAACTAVGRTWSSCSPCCRWRWATWRPLPRPTSSGCWPIRPSPTWVSSSWDSSPARRRASARPCSTRSPMRSWPPPPSA